MEHKPLYTLTFEPTRADYRKFFYRASLKRTGQAITKALLLALVISLVAVILLQTPNILFFLLVYAAVLLLLCGVFAVGVEAQAAKRLRADRSGAHPGPKTLYLCADYVAQQGRKKNMGVSKFQRVYDCRNFYAVYFNYETMYLIPKRDVPAADADGVRAYFKKKMPKAYVPA